MLGVGVVGFQGGSRHSASEGSSQSGGVGVGEKELELEEEEAQE